METIEITRLLRETAKEFGFKHKRRYFWRVDEDLVRMVLLDVAPSGSQYVEAGTFPLAFFEDQIPLPGFHLGLRTRATDVLPWLSPVFNSIGKDPQYTPPPSMEESRSATRILFRMIDTCWSDKDHLRQALDKGHPWLKPYLISAALYDWAAGDLKSLNYYMTGS